MYSEGQFVPDHSVDVVFVTISKLSLDVMLSLVSWLHIH